MNVGKGIKLMALLVSIMVVFTGCSKKEEAKSESSGRASGPEPVKIAVAFWAIDANALLIQKYLSEYVGPAFNTTFMFSEAIEDSDSLITFMENAYAAGCQGIINYQNSAIEQAIAKANELGLYIASNTTTKVENGDLPYNLGFVAATATDVANSFGDLVKDMVNDGKNHSIIIVSAGAGFGNAEHSEATATILRTLESVYGLKYESPVETLAVSRAETVVTNDKGIKIVIYPGYPMGNTYVTGMSAILQTGEYDTMLACNAAYARFAVAIDEVEKAYKKDIRISAIVMIDNETKSSFSTIDSTGNTMLNSAVLTANISQAAGLFTLVYNGATGYSEKMRVDGKGIYYNTPKWKCPSAAEYERISKIDTSNDTWEVSIDELKKMLVIFNSDADSTSIAAQLQSVTAENTLKARGL
ncbi:MAG: hypothetical protein LBI40_00660 [Treponema sp.]|jgi:hypothetical protein|nr:hypothetical protein [Treponema sp.]